MKISLVAAIAKHNVIGKGNGLPWHLPADFAHFKALTLNKPVVMGRKTYESIGKPLKQRENIIITSSPNYQAPGCKIFHSLEEVLQQIHAPEICIIGGESLYNQALPLATHLYLTYIDAEIPDADTFFPSFSPDDWIEIEREEHHPDKDNPHPFTFITLKRR